MSSRMPKLSSLLNDRSCAYMRLNPHNLVTINALVTFENDPLKIVQVRVLTVIFKSRYLETHKKTLKIQQKIFVSDKTQNLC